MACCVKLASCVVYHPEIGSLVAERSAVLDIVIMWWWKLNTVFSVDISFLWITRKWSPRRNWSYLFAFKTDIFTEYAIYKNWEYQIFIHCELWIATTIPTSQCMKIETMIAVVPSSDERTIPGINTSWVLDSFQVERLSGHLTLCQITAVLEP